MNTSLPSALLMSGLALLATGDIAFCQAEDTAPASGDNLSLASIYESSAKSARETGATGMKLCLAGRVGQGVQMIRKAADMGDTISTRNLGICTIKGIGITADVPQGIRLLEKAAEQGDTHALQSLCRVYLLLKDVRDPQKACDYARKAAAADKGAMLSYVAWHLAKEEPALAFSCAEEAAGMDNEGEGKRILANLYFTGLGCEKDEDKAEQLFREAAESNTLAQSGLMELLAQRNKHDELYAEAMKYAQGKSCDTGRLAMFVLARLHLNGSGNVEKSAEKAFFWVKRGAEEGHVPSQSLLWKMYLEKNEFAHMYHWARQAALQGDAGSQAMVARALFFGLGCDVDTEEALLWARKALKSDMTPVLNDLLSELRYKREFGDAKAADFISQLEQRSRVYGF